MSNFDFMSKFKPDLRCVKDFEYWIVCVRHKQFTLGDCVIILKREVGSLGDMSFDECVEFSKVIKWYEQLCIQKFGAVKFNYDVWMMKDNFVHYHAFPRYNKDVYFADIKWSDVDYPGLINFNRAAESRDEILEKIVEYMS